MRRWGYGISGNRVSTRAYFPERKQQFRRHFLKLSVEIIMMVCGKGRMDNVDQEEDVMQNGSFTDLGHS